VLQPEGPCCRSGGLGLWAECWVARREGFTSSVAHESRTPHSGLEFLEFLMYLGRASFTGLTRVKARVHVIVFEFMEITVKTQNNETLSYSQRPERPLTVETMLENHTHNKRRESYWTRERQDVVVVEVDPNDREAIDDELKQVPLPSYIVTPLSLSLTNR
jgi:hypothetical protein